MNLSGLKGTDVVYSFKSQDMSKSPRVTLKVSSVSWDEIDEVDRTDFMKFLFKKYKFKKNRC
jgi:hypothetical protein